MKTILFSLQLLAFSLLAHGQALNAKITSAEPKTPRFLIVNCTNNVPTACSVTDLQFTTATFYGYQGTSTNAAPTNNAAVAYIGFKDTNGVAVATGKPGMVQAIAAGSWVAIKAPPGTKYNFADMAIVGTTGDRVLITFEQ